MKFVLSLFVIAIVTACVYWYSSRKTGSDKVQTRVHWIAIVPATCVCILLLGLLGFAMYASATTPDTQCAKIHSTSSRPPAALKTYKDYFALANYEYDRGNCMQAIYDYTTALDMYPIYRQAYNNRGYTYMRMHDYQNALQDLNTALFLNPYYIQALMNRGDVYNYYYNVDKQRAVADYTKVIQLGGTKGTSVCGHMFLAQHNGWNIGTVLDFPRAMLNMCN